MAVHGVSLEIGDTGVTGLVGPNGSGKSTLFHLITGFYRLDRGIFSSADIPSAGCPRDQPPGSDSKLSAPGPCRS